MAVEKKQAAEAKTTKKKPTALKRILQSVKRNQNNVQHRSKIKTAIKNFNVSLEKKEGKEILLKKLNLIYSLVDKAVKKKIYKKNKANRLKSKYLLKTQ